MAEDFQQLSPAQQKAFLDGPALKPPDGHFNFDNPPNRNDLALGLISFCLAGSFLVVLLRFYTRVVYLKKLDIPDYLMIVAFVSFAAFCGICYHLTLSIGFIVHQWNISMRRLIDFKHTIFLAVNMYYATLGSLKVSVLLDWLHMLNPRGIRNTFFWASHVTVWVNVAWYSGSLIRHNLACIPQSKIWDVTITEGHCIDDMSWWIATASVNLVSDILILLLPHTIIWTLQLSKKKKIGISTIFAIGILACAAASWRQAAVITFVTSEDGTYTIGPLVLSICLEVLCIFMVLCTPSIPLLVSRSPLLSRIASKLWRVSPSNRWPSSSGSHATAVLSDPTMRSNAGTYRNIDDQMPLRLQRMATNTESASDFSKNHANVDCESAAW